MDAFNDEALVLDGRPQGCKLADWAEFDEGGQVVQFRPDASGAPKCGRGRTVPNTADNPAVLKHPYPKVLSFGSARYAGPICTDYYLYFPDVIPEDGDTYESDGTCGSGDTYESDEACGADGQAGYDRFAVRWQGTAHGQLNALTVYTGDHLPDLAQTPLPHGARKWRPLAWHLHKLRYG